MQQTLNDNNITRPLLHLLQMIKDDLGEVKHEIKFNSTRSETTRGCLLEFVNRKEISP